MPLEENKPCQFCVPVPIAENQLGLFSKKEIPEHWEKEWKDMPEFVQEKKEPILTVIVSFYSQDEIDEFSKIVDQRITPNTKSVRFKKIQLGQPKDFLYVED